MAKIQQCRNQCGKLITVQEHDGKWKPFDVDLGGNPTQIHNCPNSEYNKNKSGQQGTTIQPQQPKKDAGLDPYKPEPNASDRPSLESILLNQISQKLETLKKEMEDEIKETIVACYQLVKSNNDMLGAIAQNLNLTDPKKASELINPAAHVQGWNSTPNPTEEEQEDKELEKEGI